MGDESIPNIFELVSFEKAGRKCPLGEVETIEKSASNNLRKPNSWNLRIKLKLLLLIKIL